MKKVSYYYNKEIGNYYYGANHPMKPHRIKMTNELLSAYNVLDSMKVIGVTDHYNIFNDIDFTKFHSDEYIDFLSRVNPENMKSLSEQLLYFNLGEDCPVFDGMFDFCKQYTAGSIIGAHYLNNGFSDIAINWSGGLHHAKKHEASGFCYVNDCVLAILELLNYHERVLYIDIDIHHGDGVEEAFFLTNRVLTCSFHKYGDYFPGTGAINDIGYNNGRYYSVNFPLYEGMDDNSYEYIFKRTIDEINKNFRPNAIVLQCGADGLSGDRLGCFNLSIKGHGACVKYVKSLNIPMLVLGGGGYTLRNVPRCWTYETGLLLNTELEDEIPKNEYYEYFYPEYRLHIPVTNMENANSPEYLNEILEKLSENLKNVIPVTPDYCLNENKPINTICSFNPNEASQKIEDEYPDLRTDVVQNTKMSLDF